MENRKEKYVSDGISDLIFLVTVLKIKKTRKLKALNLKFTKKESTIAWSARVLATTPRMG